MNILFVNPPAYNLIEEYYNVKKKRSSGIDSPEFGIFPPLGLLYIMAYLEKSVPGHNLYLADCISEKLSYSQLEQRIKEIKPDIVGITSFSVSLIDIVNVAKTVKKLFPDTHISLGGHHCMCFPEEALSIEEIDSVIIGEGEKSFCEIVKALQNGKKLDGIEGVYTRESVSQFRQENNHRQNNDLLYPVILKPAFIDNLDELPFPARKYLPDAGFYSMTGSSKKFTTIISSRGCPYHCTMCDVPYKKYRARSINNIVDEIEECLKTGYEEFHFFDDMFNITPERVIEFSEELIKRNIKISWDFRGRVNTVTKESLEIAKKSGLRLISFGVETGTDEGLKYIKKGITVEQIKNAFKICKKLKIKTVADFMIGFPFEKTKKDVMKNIDFLISLKPDFAIISLLVIYPKTPLYYQAIEKNLINKDSWHNFCINPTKDFHPDYWTEFFSRDELLELFDSAYRKFYFRLPYIIQSVKNLNSFEEFKRKVRGFFILLKKSVL